MSATRNPRPAALALLATLLCLTPARAADWEATTTELLRTEKTGFGGLCGVLVDHQTGEVIVDLSDRGLYHSADQGKTWQRLGEELKGRTEWPGCLQLDPTGKTRRLAVALVYGSPVAVAAEPGAKWQVMNGKAAHVDWCALDWADAEPTFVLALKHESGGLLIASRDGGKSFDEVGKGHGPAWVFDDKTAVVAEIKTKDRPRPGLLRTTDGGRTFKPCGAYSTQALPKWRDGTLYWLVDGALLTTGDKGETWKEVGHVQDGRYGPIFGKDAGQMFVLTKDGIAETHDGGTTWSASVPLPATVRGGGPLTWIEYDPKHDVLYAMKMGSDLFKLDRGR
jgi:photosystem II stability/assembly factor-like uncharacterized protein